MKEIARGHTESAGTDGLEGHEYGVDALLTELERWIHAIDGAWVDRYERLRTAIFGRVKLTEKGADHLEVAIEEVVEDADNDAAERLLGLGKGPGGEEVEWSLLRARVVEALRVWLGEDVIRHRDLLERAGSLGVVRELTV